MRLKDEDLKEIARLSDEGYSTGYIANKYNYDKRGLSRIIARYRIHGLTGILHSQPKTFSIAEKLSIINRYYAGESQRSLAIEINVNGGVVHSWISKYEKLGYNGLIDNRGKPGVSKMGRPRKNQNNDKASTTDSMAPITDAEREELNKLRKENYQLKMENECLKKIQALVQQRQNRQTKKK